MAPEPALSHSATVVSENDSGTGESSRTSSPSTEGIPSPHLRETEVKSELPEQPLESKGKEPCRTHPPVLVSTKVKVEVPDLSGTTVAEATSSSSTIAQPSSSLKRSRAITAAGTDDGEDNSRSRFKRRMEAAPVFIPYEQILKHQEWEENEIYGAYEEGEEYEQDEKDEEDEEDEEEEENYEDWEEHEVLPECFEVLEDTEDPDDLDDPYLVSPEAQRYYDLGQDAAPIPFHSSLLTGSSNPPPRAEPVYHPSFPERGPLRCLDCNSIYVGFERLLSRSRHNPDRYYFVCAQCGEFICWADDEGIYEGNPRCHCEYLSREIMTNENAVTPRKLFYKCATGACRFTKFASHALSKEEVNEYYGRQIYPV
ncbi:hypothetical protein F5Y00DRAFT_156590 [Daldinia vernicosa]|uniref:uncharacterized protein n=1 Tax=Daldinia vernicosa TaxID=114800 RepID=UPI0020085C0D|nr:uncharacterized protein F5Y00DRAFT_156590 [Daldinia vernicosa]KAI0852912.1 hypothetical protein F5Y00DRAFT_156590 [Daldinia vernicosa]